MQGFLGDHVGQAVGAQQVPVSGKRLAQRQVRLGVGPAVQRAQDQRALRMGRGFVLADPALVEQRLDQGVVPGDLVELAIAQHVGARVADMAEGDPRQ